MTAFHESCLRLHMALQDGVFVPPEAIDIYWKRSLIWPRFVGEFDGLLLQQNFSYSAE